METKIISKGEIKIVGIQIKTNNKQIEKIQELWGKFFMENIGDKIKNKTNPDIIYGLYTDFESDLNGDYIFVIGFEVDNFDNMPQNLVKKIIPSSKYSVFSKAGNISQVVPELWQKIWSTDLNRTYKSDYEVYELSKMSTESCNISIYIGIQ